MDGDEYGPLPCCVALGLILFSFGLISSAHIRCKVLLPECPVTSMVPLGPIGTCRINYAYDVLSDHYVGSLDLSDSCPGADGVNHTIAVCYDDRNPSMHESSIHADGLSSSDYTDMRVVMWIGAALVGLAAAGMIALVCLYPQSAAAPSVEATGAPAATASESVLELSVPQESQPPKLRRSDSAMIDVI